MHAARRVISLNGADWRMAEAVAATQADPSAIEALGAGSRPASVPGEVRLDLMRAGALRADPFYARDNEASRWVEELDWWYWRDFDLQPAPGQRAWLRMFGADYITRTFLNGHPLGTHEGMFSRQIYEFTAMAAARNRLAVHFTAPARFPNRHADRRTRMLNIYENRTMEVGCEPHRRDTLKCQMSFGWDFAPSLRTIGLWDDVDVVLTGAVALFDLQAQTRLAGSRATLSVALDADALDAGPATFEIELHAPGESGAAVARSYDVSLPAGRARQRFELEVPEPRLWYPWDHGEPYLYTLSVCVRRDGNALDEVSERIGLREIHVRPNEGAAPGTQDWTFVINGLPVYLRGANWVPLDAIPARAAVKDYAAWLQIARDAHLNVLRVWGGGLREKRAFYERCDELGLLVWQEFPLACAFATRYPSTPAYLALVDSEVREIVRQVRNHPSVIMWCGGNEFDADQNRRVIEAMRRAATEEDPTRPFHDVSPSQGESHNWQVWHHFRPPEEYTLDNAHMMAEFGMQSPPAVESLKRFIPPDELWPPGPSWKYHRAQFQKLHHYAMPYDPQHARTLEAFVQASQRAQARGVQIAVEHARRRKYANSGFLVWQLNEPWPGIDWALVDWYRVPKLAYRRLAEIANPLLVSLDYPLHAYAPGSAFNADAWALNDYPREYAGCRVEIEMGALRESFACDVHADSAAIAGRVAWVLPAGEWKIECRLVRGSELLSVNHYDLREYDGRRPPIRR